MFKLKDKMENIAIRAMQWIGSPLSIILHTVLFITAFLIYFMGIKIEDILLVLTTIVSLEAIYLSIFIQMGVNIQSNKLTSVVDEIEDIQENVEDIQENVEDIQENVEDIQENVEDIQKDVEEINEEDEDQEDDEILNRIESMMNNLIKEVNELKKHQITLKKRIG